MKKPKVKSVVLRTTANTVLELIGSKVQIIISKRKGKKYPQVQVRFICKEIIRGISVDGLFAKINDQAECKN